MIKQINLVLCLSTAIFATTQVHAQDINLNLAPQADKVISNNTPWTIHATCQLHSGSAKKTITIHGVKNGAQVNGKELFAGQSTSMTVYEEKTVQVTAEPGAQVTIMNSSDESVAAVCST